MQVGEVSLGCALGKVERGREVVERVEEDERDEVGLVSREGDVGDHGKRSETRPAFQSRCKVRKISLASSGCGQRGLGRGNEQSKGGRLPELTLRDRVDSPLENLLRTLPSKLGVDVEQFLLGEEGILGGRGFGRHGCVSVVG